MTKAESQHKAKLAGIGCMLCRRLHGPHEPGPVELHHLRTGGWGKLQGVESGEIPNLMVLMPPGSAKSTYSDVVFVPWFMSRKARRNVILASYASDIAKKQGRRARQLIQSKSFYNLTGLALKDDQKAADEWALSNGSEYMSGGLLSGLTGNRGALGILDDPIKGRRDAESETIRNSTWDAYINDFCSRLIPGAPQVMILTRWHEDDPAGLILPRARAARVIRTPKTKHEEDTSQMSLELIGEA